MKTFLTRLTFILIAVTGLAACAPETRDGPPAPVVQVSPNLPPPVAAPAPAGTPAAPVPAPKPAAPPKPKTTVYAYRDPAAPPEPEPTPAPSAPAAASSKPTLPDQTPHAPMPPPVPVPVPYQSKPATPMTPVETAKSEAKPRAPTDTKPPSVATVAPPKPAVAAPAPPPEPVKPPPAPPIAAPNLPPAAQTLASQAEQQRQAGDYAGAAASLERSLRIDAPREDKAYLWNRLARVRMEQGQASQAATFAARSNDLAGGNAVVKQDNWRIIAESKRRAGDTAGASEAERRAGLK